jgi:RHS repeat-associated protein
VRLVTDQNGNVVGRHDFLPFGEEVPANTASRNSQWGAQTDTVETKFTGQVRDLENGLDFFNARYYGPALGRFMSPDPGQAGADPTDPQTWNAYAYVRGNPMAMVDPTGMQGTFGLSTTCSWDASFQYQQCTPDMPSGFTNNLPSQTPTDMAQGESQYLQGVAQGYLQNAAAQNPSIMQYVPAAGSIYSVIVYDPLRASAFQQMASSIVNSNDDVAVGMDIWGGQQKLWSNTATVGNALGAATAAVLTLPAVAAVEAPSLLGPAEGRVFGTVPKEQ